MTVAERRGTASKAATNVVEEIAARRREDIAAEFAAHPVRVEEQAAEGPEPRSFVEPFLTPGLHLIAEVKRSSPSAGRIAGDSLDIVEQARAYAAGGAAAISVLCEPHWFGGSVDDVRRVRAAVSVPVLAKEFVVDPKQFGSLRAAGADAVLILVVLHPSKRRLRLLVSLAMSLGLEPLVEAHDRRELELALESGARVIGINNRDLRTLDVDVERADRLRALVPDDRVVIAESGVRDASTVARWRALGIDGALVGEAFMRAADPAAAVRSFVAAGRPPADPANVARRPFVKVCGVTDPDGVVAAVAAGADAIGLNVVAGTPRALDSNEAGDLATFLRAVAPPGRRPKVVLVTADARPDLIRETTAAVDPDAIQANGRETTEAFGSLPDPAGRCCTCRRATRATRDARRAARSKWPVPSSRPAPSGSCSIRPVDRIRAARANEWRRRSPWSSHGKCR